MFASPLLVSSLHVYNQWFVHILHVSLHGAFSGHASSHKNVFPAAANGMTTSLSPSSSPSPSPYHSNTTGITTRNSGDTTKIHTELESHIAMVISQTNQQISASLYLAEMHIHVLLKEDAQLF
jgi:hypothetical protein